MEQVFPAFFKCLLHDPLFSFFFFFPFFLPFRKNPLESFTGLLDFFP